MKAIATIFLLFVFSESNGQTLGGSSAYTFLKLPASTILTATGGVNASYISNEAGMAFNNPALLQKSLHGQLHLAFNNFLGGIKAYTAGGVMYKDKQKTSFGAQVFFVDYGSVPQADAAGNAGGTFRPVDFTIQVSAAKKYLEKWSYGATLKFINSSYQQYISNAIAFDVGILYNDSVHGFSASVLAKNMGFALKSYGGQPEELPFDLEAGITKRLKNAPFGFSLTVQQLHRFNTVYSDTVFNNDNEAKNGVSFLDKIGNHFVVATHIYLGQHLEGTIGYNHLRRTELSTPQGGDGLTGFSIGLRLKAQKLEVQAAHSSYQKGVYFDQIGLIVKLDKLISGL